MKQLSDEEFNKKLEKITDNIINKFQEEMYNRKDSEKFIMLRLEEMKQNRMDKETCMSELKTMIIELEHKATELRKEVSLLQEDRKQQKEVVKRLEINYHDLEKVYEIREQELASASKTLKMSSTDKEILGIARKKLSIYKDLTNIEWDYSIPMQNSHVVGYVENSKHSYIQAFNYNKDKMTEAKVTEILWQEIEKGIAGDWKNLLQIKEKEENKNEICAEN